MGLFKHPCFSKIASQKEVTKWHLGRKILERLKVEKLWKCKTIVTKHNTKNHQHFKIEVAHKLHCQIFMQNLTKAQQ